VIAAQRHRWKCCGTKKQRAADVLGAQAGLASARLKLGYTKIIAPFDGVRRRASGSAGRLRQYRQQPDQRGAAANVYVMANYKETQLTRVKPGQSVDITVDSFPNEKLRAASSGSRRQRLAIRAAAAG